MHTTFQGKTMVLLEGSTLLSPKTTSELNETKQNGGELVDINTASIIDNKGKLKGNTYDNTGKILLRFINSDDKPPCMKIEFKNMCAEVAKEPGSKELKTILTNVSGTVYPGELVALMGPSGAGKSTLLNVLGNRFDAKYTGDIYINGIKKNKNIKKYLGYVLQHDTLLPNLTVFETLNTTAQLRLPKNITKNKKIERVNDIIYVMGLEKCKNTSINDISGGESKRLSIANELLTNPSILFLDEPTSGLDSTTAISILNTLQNLTKKGRTIICSIHQPSSQMFNKFDKLALMVASKLIYFGDVSSILNYFDNIGYKCAIHCNPADFLLELITDNLTNEDDTMFNKTKKEIINHLQIEWEKNEKNIYEKEYNIKKDMKVDNIDIYSNNDNNNSKWNTNWFQQFIILYMRAYRHRRGHLITWLKFFEYGMVCFLCGILWFQIPHTEQKLTDFMGAAFCVQINLLFVTMFLGLVHFPTEKLVIKKERQSGSYRLSAYFFSKILAENPINIFMPCLGLTIVFWLIGFSDYFAAYVLYLILTILGISVANSYGIMCGCSMNRFERSLSLASVTSVFMMFLSGFFIKDSSLPVFMKPFKYISTMRYGYLSTLNILLDYTKFSCDIDSVYERCSPTHIDYDGYIYKQEILNFYSLNEPMWLCIVILFLQFFIFLSIAYIFLRKTTKTLQK